MHMRAMKVMGWAGCLGQLILRQDLHFGLSRRFAPIIARLNPYRVSNLADRCSDHAGNFPRGCANAFSLNTDQGD